MSDWMSMAEVTKVAFDRSPVVMANEAHFGLLRCVRTRVVGAQIVRAAHEVGVRRLAMEALPSREFGTAITRLPDTAAGYLGQSEMRALMATALDLGWTLWAYEMTLTPDRIQTEDVLTREFTNQRELAQATNLARLQQPLPANPLLVWCGNGHATKVQVQDWIPMGKRFKELSGIDPFVLDQIESVEWPDEPEPPAFPDDLCHTLSRLGGGPRDDHRPN